MKALWLSDRAYGVLDVIAWREDRPNPFGAIVRPRCYRSSSGCGRWVGDCDCWRNKRTEAGL